MKKISLFVIFILALFLLFGCSDAYKDGGYDYVPSELEDGTQTIIEPGQITAAELIDQENYASFLALFSSNQGEGNGAFFGYVAKGYYDGRNMIQVTVSHEETALQGVSIELITSTQEILFRARTNANGVAYLCPKTSDLEHITDLKVFKDDVMMIYPYTYSETSNILDISLDAPHDKEDIIEIMFVIDTTGSMSDELEYLKAEVDDVIAQIKIKLPNTIIRLALLFYRDIGDQYVTRYFDFTENITTQRTHLSNQSANGGGDWPEAVDRALFEAVNKAWLSSNTTKLIIHVLDAPPHDDAQKMSTYMNAVHQAAAMGIRMIPVASSGVDRYLEFLLRHQALYTGGSYVFLTNDSGIGGDHLPPVAEGFVVEYLNELLVRVIIEQHTGVKGIKNPINQTQNQPDA